MASKGKWYYMISLSLAGLVSLVSTLVGGVLILGLAWMGSPPKAYFPFVLLVLGVPLFLLALEVSKRFILFIWALAVIYPLSLILIEGGDFSSRSFLMILAGAGTISLVLLAALLRYSASLELPPIETDSEGVKNGPHD